tara:strand:- start:187 stop:597 length:411 start_codon:yes stop_codon:yes gene_type:complete
MSNIINWLNGGISKYSDITNKEYIQSIFAIIYEWLQQNDKLYLKYSPEEILKIFYIFIYNKHLFENDSCEMIDMYFTSDITDLYFEINNKYGTILLDERGITSNDILIFFNHISFFYEDDSNIEEEEIIYSDEIIM